MVTSREEKRRTRRYAAGMIILAAALIVLMLWYVCSGSVSTTPAEVLRILFRTGSGSAAPAAGSAETGAGSSADTVARIILQIRVPRMWAAMILGGALAVSGFLLQTFFGNPIAGPYILGISSGAKLVVALVMIGLLERGIVIHSWGMVLAAFAGSLIAMGFVLLLSLRVSNMSVLVVCGIMIGYICTAVTDFVVTFADDSNIVNLHNWSQGSFSGTTSDDVRIMAVLTAAAVIGAFLLSKPISAYLMGETYARSVGVNIKALRVVLILLSSLLSACVTAFAGPVSFVGIAVPHLIRLLTGSAKPIQLIPACFLGGAVITLLCDGIARCAFAPVEVSVSSVTAVFLAPVVIVLMVRQRAGKKQEDI